ncbi:MAG: C39 family peptidase [Syntrophobacteraceae bacterium]
MLNTSHTRSLNAFARTALFGLVLLFSFILSGLPAAQAQEADRPGETVSAKTAQVISQRSTKYFTSTTLLLNGKTLLDRYQINGPPKPPLGFDVQRSAVALPAPDKAMGMKTLTVPAFDWVFGCSSVSGAMIAGYYDRNGYPNMYTGPTDGGVMPLDNSSWPTWSDGVDTYPNIPLAGSHQGVDGRTTRGSIDDYWVEYGSSADDPFITGGWDEHTWSDAIGDYMKTSQSTYGSTDGSTWFYTWTSDPAQLTCDDMVSYGIGHLDGTVGRKLFYEARGYTVTDCYNQKTDNTIAGGFSFAQYKTEIDAGRPVMLNLDGHTIVGVGYNDIGSTVYIHDTWDYLNHTMTWGGSYSGMELLSVSIVNLQAAAEQSKAMPWMDLLLNQ